MADMAWHALEARAVLDALGVDPTRGLDPAEADVAVLLVKACLRRGGGSVVLVEASG